MTKMTLAPEEAKQDFKKIINLPINELHADGGRSFSINLGEEDQQVLPGEPGQNELTVAESAFSLILGESWEYHSISGEQIHSTDFDSSDPDEAQYELFNKLTHLHPRFIKDISFKNNFESITFTFDDNSYLQAIQDADDIVQLSHRQAGTVLSFDNIDKCFVRYNFRAV